MYTNLIVHITTISLTFLVPQKKKKNTTNIMTNINININAKSNIRLIFNTILQMGIVITYVALTH